MDSSSTSSSSPRPSSSSSRSSKPAPTVEHRDCNVAHDSVATQSTPVARHEHDFTDSMTNRIQKQDARTQRRVEVLQRNNEVVNAASGLLSTRKDVAKAAMVAKREKEVADAEFAAELEALRAEVEAIPVGLDEFKELEVMGVFPELLTENARAL